MGNGNGSIKPKGVNMHIKRKVVTFVVKWDEKDGGTVSARIEFVHRNTDWLVKTGVKPEVADAVGDNLLNTLKAIHL